MVRQVNLYEAKTRLSQLVEDAAKGEEIVIAKNGKAKARLIAVPAEDKPKPRQLGQLAKLLTAEERAYLGSERFLRDSKAMDVEIERDFHLGLEEDTKEYKSRWRDISSTRTHSSGPKKHPKRSGRKRSKR